VNATNDPSKFVSIFAFFYKIESSLENKSD